MRVASTPAPDCLAVVFEHRQTVWWGCLHSPGLAPGLCTTPHACSRPGNMRSCVMSAGVLKSVEDWNQRRDIRQKLLQRLSFCSERGEGMVHRGKTLWPAVGPVYSFCRCAS